MMTTTEKIVLGIAITLAFAFVPSACGRTGITERSDAATMADTTAVEADVQQLVPDADLPNPDLSPGPDAGLDAMAAADAGVDVVAPVDVVAQVDTGADAKPVMGACSVGWQETKEYSLPAGELFKNDVYCVPTQDVDAGAGVVPCAAGFVRTWYGASVVLCPPYPAITTDGGTD